MKFLKTSLQENIKSKSMPTAEMYEAKTLTKINRAGQFLSVLSVIMGLWVIASVIFPAVTPLTPADFGKQGWLTLIPLVIIGTCIVIYNIIESNPAVFRLHPARPMPDDLDEWEQDMRRRIAEVVIRKIALGAASILILFVAVTILDTQGQNPSIPILSLFVASLAAVNAMVGVIYKVIGNAATPSD